MPALLLPARVPPPLARWLADRYDLLDEIGRGGASVVHRARDRSTGREVAVKLVDPAAGDASALVRFAREARIVGAQQHPNVVQTLAAEAGGGAAAFVTEYVAGGTLRAALHAAVEEGVPWPYARVAGVLRDVAAALAHAHAGRVVHRDVKPENVLLDDGTGRACLADFGIAVLLDRPGFGASDGEAAGTPSYMAPEQIAGRPVDERTDVYALGLVGWEMLTGRRPWAGEPLHLVLHKQQHETLPALAALRPDIPAYLLAAVEGALAKDPRGRWRDGAEFLHALSPTPARLPPVAVPDDGAAAATVRFADQRAERRVGAGGWRCVRHAARRVPGRVALAGAAAVALGAFLATTVPGGRGPTRPGGDPVARPPAAAQAAVTRPVAYAPAYAPAWGTWAGRVRAAPATASVSRPPAAPPSDDATATTATTAPPAAAPRVEAPTAASSAADRRLARAATAQVAAAYAALADAMRQSAGVGREPRAVHALVVEQRRWAAEHARGCDVGRDAACLADRAARKVAELERRRARFAIDPEPGLARARWGAPAAGAHRPR